MLLPDFRLETHFSRWAFRSEHHLTVSDVEAMPMQSPSERLAIIALENCDHGLDTSLAATAAPIDGRIS